MKYTVFSPVFDERFLQEGELVLSQPTITCSKLTVETLEQGVKYIQS